MMHIPAVSYWKLNILLCLAKHKAKKISRCLHPMEHFTVYILDTVQDWKFNASEAVGTVK